MPYLRRRSKISRLRTRGFFRARSRRSPPPRAWQRYQSCSGSARVFPDALANAWARGRSFVREHSRRPRRRSKRYAVTPASAGGREREVAECRGGGRDDVRQAGRCRQDGAGHDRRSPRSWGHVAAERGRARHCLRSRFCALIVPQLCTEGRHQTGRRGIERERRAQTISWVCWASPRLLSFLFGTFTWVRLPAPPLLITLS
jgi:hypothetical protein